MSGKKIAQIDDQQYISAPHYQGVNRYRTLHAAGGDDVDEGVIEEMEEDHQEYVDAEMDRMPRRRNTFDEEEDAHTGDLMEERNHVYTVCGPSAAPNFVTQSVQLARGALGFGGSI